MTFKTSLDLLDYPKKYEAMLRNFLETKSVEKLEGFEESFGHEKLHFTPHSK